MDIKGSTPKQDYAAHITFRGLTFAYSDWNLAEVDGSHGNATVQGCTYMNKFSTGNWHDDMYRSYDVAPAAVHATSAHDIAILDGKIEMTGYLGFHAENDVYNIEATISAIPVAAVLPSVIPSMSMRMILRSIG